MIPEKLENSNPAIFKRLVERVVLPSELDDLIVDKIDAREVFDYISGINDPEHPLTLEELNVVEERLIEVDDDASRASVNYTPTVPHCSMAVTIGLCIKVKLMRSLPPRFKIDVEITPGTHVSEAAINKQLADKERVAAALEKPSVLAAVNQCLSPNKS